MDAAARLADLRAEAYLWAREVAAVVHNDTRWEGEPLSPEEAAFRWPRRAAVRGLKHDALAAELARGRYGFKRQRAAAEAVHGGGAAAAADDGVEEEDPSEAVAALFFEAVRFVDDRFGEVRDFVTHAANAFWDARARALALQQTPPPPPPLNRPAPKQKQTIAQQVIRVGDFVKRRPRRGRWRRTGGRTSKSRA